MEEKKKRKYVKKSEYWNGPRSDFVRKSISFGKMKKHFKGIMKELFEKKDENGKNKD